MCSKKYGKGNLNATGLVEVIVVLAIMAVTLVTVVSVTTRGLRQVKRDEVEDRAIGYQLRSLEIAKSPAKLTFPGDLQHGDTVSYFIDYSNAVWFVQAQSGQALTEQTCTPDSEYWVAIEGAGEGEAYCNQVIVEYKFMEQKKLYTVKSIMVYNTGDKFEKKELLTFRRE